MPSPPRLRTPIAATAGPRQDCSAHASLHEHVPVRRHAAPVVVAHRRRRWQKLARALFVAATACSSFPATAQVTAEPQDGGAAQVPVKAGGTSEEGQDPAYVASDAPDAAGFSPVPDGTGDFVFPPALRGMGPWHDGAQGWIRSQLPAVDSGAGDSVSIMEASDEWLWTATQRVEDAWRSVAMLSTRFGSIYGSFGPLRPALSGSERSVIAVLSNQAALRRISGVVWALLDTSRTLAALARALANILEVVDQVRRLLVRAVSQAATLPEGGTSSPLDGPDLRDSVTGMRNFAEASEAHTQAFDDARVAISDLLEQVPDQPAMSDGDEAELRLSVTRHAERYETMLNAVLITWARAERLAVAMCPAIAEARSDAAATRCHVARAIAQRRGTDAELSSDVCGTSYPTTGVGICPSERLSGHLHMPRKSSSWTAGGLLLAAFGLCGVGSLITSAVWRRGTPLVGHAGKVHFASRELNGDADNEDELDPLGPSAGNAFHQLSGPEE